MKVRDKILIAVGAFLFAGFCGFVLLISFLLAAADDIEREQAGKLTIAVRHKMIYYRDVPSAVQCVEPQVGLCETPAIWNRERHLAGGSRCEVRSSAPQPFLRQPELSDFAEFEFDLEPGKTYYWYVHFENEDRCFGWLPAEIERFETGEIKMAEKETKRIEKDFTK
jgi:hypothetical protein